MKKFFAPSQIDLFIETIRNKIFKIQCGIFSLRFFNYQSYSGNNFQTNIVALKKCSTSIRYYEFPDVYKKIENFCI